MRRTLISPLLIQLRNMHDGQASSIAEFLGDLDQDDQNNPEFIIACMDEFIAVAEMVKKDVAARCMRCGELIGNAQGVTKSNGLEHDSPCGGNQ